MQENIPSDIQMAMDVFQSCAEDPTQIAFIPGEVNGVKTVLMCGISEEKEDTLYPLFALIAPEMSAFVVAGDSEENKTTLSLRRDKLHS